MRSVPLASIALFGPKLSQAIKVTNAIERELLCRIDSKMKDDERDNGPRQYCNRQLRHEPLFLGLGLPLIAVSSQCALTSHMPLYAGKTGLGHSFVLYEFQRDRGLHDEPGVQPITGWCCLARLSGHPCCG